MDLCALYGQDNERMTQKIVEQIFKSQPKYYDDLKECTAALISVRMAMTNLYSFSFL